MKPKNQHQQVLYYLNKYSFWFSLNVVIQDSFFYKFQTRLAEIESEHGKLVDRKRTKFKNRFGNKSSYVSYKTCVSNKRLNELFKLYI